MAERDGTALTEARDLARGLRDLASSDAPAGLLPSVLVDIGLADAYFGLDSPIGPIFVAYSTHGVAATGLGTDTGQFAAGYTRRFGRSLRFTPAPPVALARLVSRRLRGERSAVPLDLRGLSAFERATLMKTAEVPRGEVRPYSWVARQIDRAGAVRAVGSALGRNPVPLLIPCHRIVRSDGQIGQYIFGVETKRLILAAEGLAPDQLESAARRGTRYLGSDTTGIYCFPTCRNARRITAPHRVTFASDAAARAAGFRPCAVCRP